MDEYLCITLRSGADEAEEAFKGRITGFWTHMLRNKPDDYEKIYAEATAFERDGGAITRQYLVEAGVIDVLTAELRAAGLDCEPIDADDLYSKYEAAPPDWFWIEH